MVYLGSEPQKSINTTPKNIFICPSWKETQCMQKGLCMMHSVRLCLLVTRLDAAAPGGASSNRRWGVDTGAPGAPATTAPGHLGIQSGPRPCSSVKRERELGGPGRELKIKGGSRPGLGGCTDCNPGGLWSTPSIHHRFLFSLSPPPNFATAQISVHCSLCTRHHSPEHSLMCGQNWDFERICEPSLFLQLDFGQSGRSDLSQKMRNVNGSAVTRAFPWRKYWLLTLKLLDPTSI